MLTKIQEDKLIVILLMLMLQNSEIRDQFPEFDKLEHEDLCKDLPVMATECLAFFGIDIKQGDIEFAKVAVKRLADMEELLDES